MKKMNVIPLFISLFLMVSCSNNEQIINKQTETSKTFEKEQNENLYALQVYYVSAVAEIHALELKKASLIAALENGNKDVIKEIEQVQKKLEKLNRFKENLLDMKLPKAPRPIKMPPVGCLENGNCNPMQNLTHINKMVLGDTFKILSLEIKDAENNVVGRGTSRSRDSYGQSAIKLETAFTGEATMTTTLAIKDIDEITLTTPVFKNN